MTKKQIRAWIQGVCKNRNSKSRALVMTLAVMVVFVTTYMLILPAITLDKDAAQKQGGVGLPAAEQTSETETDREIAADKNDGSEADAVKDAKDAKAAKDAADGEDSDSSEAAGTDSVQNEDAQKTDAQEKTEKDNAGESDERQDADKASGDGQSKTQKKDSAEENRSASENKELQTGKISFEGKGFTVEADCDAKAKIPEGAELVAEQVRPDSKEYDKWYEEALKALQKEKGGKDISGLSFAQFYDISFQSEGGAVEPSSSVNVKISYDKAVNISDADNVRIVHFAVDKKGKMTPEILDAEPETAKAGKKETLEAASFETASFSMFGVVETETLETEVLTADGSSYKVSVTCDEAAGVPEGAKLAVSEITPEGKSASEYSDYVAKTEKTLGMKKGSAEHVRLFDIKIVDADGNKVDIAAPVDVKIELAGRDGEKNAQVVHFADGAKNGEIVDGVKTDGENVSFEADGFSVYAVVDDGSSADEARATVNFYGKNTNEPIATVYVKNDDTAEEIQNIIFDPGCGELDASKRELFDGWVISTTNTTDGSSYTIDTEGKTIEDVRAALESMEIKEGDVVNIYAKIVRTITVLYKGEDDSTVLGSVTLKVIGSDDPNNPDSIAEYDISMNYTPETSTQAFMGWNVAEGASNIISAKYNGEDVSAPYLNGTTIRLNGDVTLSVNAPNGHWLVFDENGKGATYNAPEFIKDGEKTHEPPFEMTRLGYRFEGWYTDKDCTEGNEFTFGEELADNTTIYAKWTAANTANYTVIVWKERMTDTYAENGGTGEGKDKNYDFAESYTFTGNVGETADAVSDGNSSVVDGDAAGTSYNNARIRGVGPDGNVNKTIAYTGYHCSGYDTNVEITPEGNSVINVYYDRNTVTYTFYTYGQSTTDGTWWLCRENGSQIIRDGGNANNNTRIAIRNGNEYSQYTGRVSHDDGRTYYYSISTGCGGTDMREAHWEYVSNSGSSWNVYQESTGLYGEKLNWPTDTSIWWYEGHNNTSGTGTRMTYKDAFLPTDSDMTVEYWGNTSSASGMIHFWTQDVEGGNSYTDQVQVATGNANFSINDKFTGFYAYQYRIDNDAWRNVGELNESTGIYGSPVSYNNRLDIRYNRIKAAINFLDGSYFDGNGNRLDETPQAEEFHKSQEYFYEADVSSYNKGGADYYTPPEKVGYTFAGWYADDACTVLYDFNTMPATGITVYAKWIQNQYRVFLHPNVPESDTTLNWGSENQDMTFRVSSGGKVSTPSGTRNEYKLIGWYLDEACTQVFDGERYVLTDTSVTTPYNKETDYTDVMNKYGNIVGEGTNADLTGYNGGERFWITKKLDLYAKWRAELLGAEGIGVSYDANGGSNAPSDTNLYLDNSDTVAQGASTPPDDTQQFLYWVLQRWDESSGKYVDAEGSDNKIYPGESFTVLKSDAYVEEMEGSTADNPKYRYTVQLRAQYGPKDEPTPTHLTWYGNGGQAGDGTESYTDSDLQINEAVNIRPANTFTRAGYSFLGWARVDSSAEGYSLSEKDLTADDLFLKYENGKFYAQITEGSDEWSEVSKVAADERDPYHDLYAVWEKKTYTVTVTKAVEGLDSDINIPFSFTPAFEGLTASDYTSAFQLVGNENGADVEISGDTVHYEHTKSFIEVPYGTVFSITEHLDPDSTFEVSESCVTTNADVASDNGTVNDLDNGSEITVKGDVALTVMNTRNTQKVRVMKTEMDKETPLGGAVFSVTVDGTDFILTSDKTDGYLKSEIFTDGIMTVPYGVYELTETTSPDGYLRIDSAVRIRVDQTGVHADNYTIEDPTGSKDYYTVIIPNNPGVALPSTGGSGVNWIYLLGCCIIVFAGVLLLGKKRLRQTEGDNS